MKIAAVEELLRTGYRSATIRALELLIQSAAIVWDERRGTVFRTQLGPWIFAVAVIDADHLKVLCINEDGEMKIVSISRRGETQLPSERRSAARALSDGELPLPPLIPPLKQVPAGPAEPVGKPTLG